MDFPWYQTIQNSPILEQGDLIYDCPIIRPPKNFEKLEEGFEVEIDNIDCIILSQSCDLENGKIDYVLVCPFYTETIYRELLAAENITSVKRQNSYIKEISKGHVHKYHLLNKQENILDELLIVDFSNVFGIQIDTLKEFVKKGSRIRLLPPYKEHISQAFARYFMRVGLPVNLDLNF